MAAPRTHRFPGPPSALIPGGQDVQGDRCLHHHEIVDALKPGCLAIMPPHRSRDQGSLKPGCLAIMPLHRSRDQGSLKPGCLAIMPPHRSRDQGSCLPGCQGISAIGARRPRRSNMGVRRARHERAGQGGRRSVGSRPPHEPHLRRKSFEKSWSTPLT